LILGGSKSHHFCFFDLKVIPSLIIDVFYDLVVQSFVIYVLYDLVVPSFVIYVHLMFFLTTWWFQVSLLIRAG